MFQRSVPELAPYEHDPNQRIRAMNHAAAQILMERGRAALTHRAVAARAGVSLGSTTKYYDSIDALRDGGLRVISDEIDRDLDDVTRQLACGPVTPTDLAELMYAFLTDAEQVRASMALTTAAVADPEVRALALRWTDRLVEILTPTVGHAGAVALGVYLDGATTHAVLRDRPLSQEAVAAAVDALCTIPGACDTARETGVRP